MTKKELAIALHDKGYNCAQAVVCAFSDELGIDEEKIKLIYSLYGNRLHDLSKVVIPGSIPSIISNMKVNIGLCLVGVIIGEFLAAKNGLGYLIIYSSQVFSCVYIWVQCDI